MLGNVLGRRHFGAKLNAGSDLLEGIGLFENTDAQTSLRERKRGGESADAAAIMRFDEFP